MSKATISINLVMALEGTSAFDDAARGLIFIYPRRDKARPVLHGTFPGSSILPGAMLGSISMENGSDPALGQV